MNVPRYSTIIGSWGRTQLRQNIHGGKLKCVEDCFMMLNAEEISWLLSEKIDEDMTPLMIACYDGHKNIVHYLLKYRLDVDQSGTIELDAGKFYDSTPLVCAAVEGHYSIVRQLVNHGADVNRPTKCNTSPLLAACLSGNYEIVQFLVSRGAKLEVVNDTGTTCLMVASAKGDVYLVRYFLHSGLDVNQKNKRGNAAIHLAFEGSNENVVELLLEYGADINSTNDVGLTALKIAACFGHTKTVSKLLARCNVSLSERIDALELIGSWIIDGEDDTQTAIAYWQMADKLRREYRLKVHDSIDFDKLNDIDQIRLQSLSIRDRIIGSKHRINLYFLMKRADFYKKHHRFDQSLPCLTKALHSQPASDGLLNPKIVECFRLFAILLRKLGTVSSDIVTDVYVKLTQELVTALTFSTSLNKIQAKAYDNLSVMTLHLLRYIVKTDHCDLNMFRIKCATYQLQKLRELRPIRIGLLSMSVLLDMKLWDLKVVKLLLECGANVGQRDEDGNTPLHYAVVTSTKRKAIACNIFLANNAHLDTKNEVGNTPLDFLDQHCQVLPLKHITLQCIAAKTIRRENIRYGGHLPQHLEIFVNEH